MKQKWLIPLAILVLASLACTVNLPVPIQTVEVGAPQRYTINESKPEGDGPFSLTLSMGAGKLSIQPGADGWVEGKVDYNVSQFQPIVERNSESLIIKQEVQWNNQIPTNLDDIENNWQIKLGNVPMDLNINSGMSESEIDLGGVPLTNLSINGGASTSDIQFTDVNPQNMTVFTYRTGASTVKIDGLANANFASMSFIGGVGSYTLDFRGDLQRPASVRIEGGVSDYKIIVPSFTNCRVNIEGGVNNVTVKGDWESTGTGYRLEGDTPALNITVVLGVGSLQLIED